MAAATKITTIFSAMDKFSAPVRRMGSKLEQFAAKAETTTARADRAFRRMTSPVRKLVSSLGTLGVMVGGAAIIQGVRQMIGVFMSFEQANANLSSVMKDGTSKQFKELSDDAKRLGATTAKTATEVVGLQESFARLGFGSDAILDMTEATINGSIAMQAELTETADLAGAMVNTFTNFNSGDAGEILDKLTLSTQTSALNFEKLSTGLPIVAGAANSAGIGFSELLSLMGKLSDAGIDASMSSNALKNIFIESAGQGLNYQQILEKIKASSNKLTTSFDELGKRPAVAGTVLAEKLGEIDTQTQLLNESWEGTAAKTADKQLKTLSGSLTILGSAYEGFILSMEDGNGSLSYTLTRLVHITTEILSLASGTGKLSEEMDEGQKRIRVLAERGIKLLKVLGWITGAFIVFKAAILIAQGVLFTYNVLLGAQAALSGTASIAIGANATALGAYKLVLGIATAAQWLFNTAMAMNPIGLVIIAVVALVAVIALVISKWDEWGAALSLFLGPLGIVIALVQSFRRNWELIGDAFKEGGMLAGIKMIGKTLLDSILMPLQQLLEIASGLPGKMGALAATGAAKIEAFRAELGLNVEKKELANPAQERQEGLSKELKESLQKVSIDINDNTGNAEVSSDADFVPINVTSTHPA
tara:strand:- start:1610 stop:3553 length:1944 start_codon:yes stop_codon:yes gene_type:complete